MQVGYSLDILCPRRFDDDELDGRAGPHAGLLERAVAQLAVSEHEPLVPPRDALRAGDAELERDDRVGRLDPEGVGRVSDPPWLGFRV